jgi:hypothetical protein
LRSKLKIAGNFEIHLGEEKSARDEEQKEGDHEEDHEKCKPLGAPKDLVK